MEEPAERLERLVGSGPTTWETRAAPWQPPEAIEGGNARWSVTLEDGRRVFVKEARSEGLAAALRREGEVYAHLRGSFMPAFVAFEDDPERPLRVIEDLSDADWEPRWDPGRVEAVRAALAELATSPAPAWLERALPDLAAAAGAAHVDGDALLHLDVRSDNICFRGGAPLLVDWNWCSLGNADFDVAAWLPSLAVEGGPQPWEVLPGAGELAAFLAGVWAAVVGLPPPATAPTLRELQRGVLAVAVEWCERELALEP